MSRPHDLDEMFPADTDDAFELDLRPLFIAAQSPGTTEELASQAAVVADMTNAMNRQASSVRLPRPRAASTRAIGSRAAKVAMVTGIAVISTSAAAAAGLLPQPAQHAVERAAQYAGWHSAERNGPATTTTEHLDPTTTTTDRIATVQSTTPRPAAADPSLTTDQLCRAWALSIRSGVPLEPEATRALAAMAERSGQAVERQCGPDVPTAPEILVPAEASTTPVDARPSPPTVPTVIAPDIPTAATVPPATNNKSPNTSHTLPPQAQGNEPSASVPNRGDHANNGNPNEPGNDNPTVNGNDANNSNGNSNSNGNANSNPNGISNARNVSVDAD
jgi:hypothetical protein